MGTAEAHEPTETPTIDDPDTPIEGAGGPTDATARPEVTPPPPPPPPGAY